MNVSLLPLISAGEDLATAVHLTSSSAAAQLNVSASLASLSGDLIDTGPLLAL